MATIKISEMPSATTFEDDDYAMIVQSNNNKKITKQNILESIKSDIIVDSYNTSTTNGYSCNYMNNNFATKGTILWTNLNPTSAFSSQTITLSSDDYDYLDIIYLNYAQRGTYETARVYKTYPHSEIGGTFNYTGSVFTGTRELEIQNDTTKIHFDTAYGIQISNPSLAGHSDWYIPTKIIGYKL